MESAQEKIWITWENQRRNRTLSSKLDARLYEIVCNRSRLVRYASSMIKTLKIISAHKPKILFVQNPSIVLTIYCLLIRNLFGYKLVVDAHNAGLFPREGKNPLLNVLARVLARRADFLIVTNANLAGIVKDWGGRPVVLPDPMPALEGFPGQQPGGNAFNIVFVCSWSSDEPYAELIEAAAQLGPDYLISITGNWSGKVARETIPANVRLTGFLPEPAYVQLLQRSDLVIVLTTRDDCLNCGAYEAISLEKPLILSNKQALKEYFRHGVIFTDNDSESIRENLRFGCANRENLRKEIGALKKQLLAEWEEQRAGVETTLRA